MKQAVGVNGTLSGWKHRVETLQRASVNELINTEVGDVLMVKRDIHICQFCSGEDPSRVWTRLLRQVWCNGVRFTLSQRSLRDEWLKRVSGVWTVLMVRNAHTWVSGERKRAGVQSDNPLFSHCGKLNVNEQSVWRLPAAGYKSPLQALSHTHKHSDLISK